jgi:RHS repeat-associated protein
VTARTRFIVIAGFILSLAALAWAQDPTVIPTRVNAQNRTGNLPFSTTVGSDIERVDVATGNLIVDIPIISLPGRGMDFNFGLNYNAMFWYASRRTNIFNEDLEEWKLEYRGTSAIALGWNETRPRVTSVSRSFPCTAERAIYRLNYIYHDPQGGKHPMAIQQSTTSNCVINDTQGPDLTGDGMRGTLFSISPNGANIRMADGKIFDQSGPNGAVWRDSNGNIVNDYDLKDTLGRQVVTITTPTNQRVYRVTDSDGVQRDYTVNLGTVNLATAFNATPTCPALGIYELIASQTAITSIVLPNGTSYQFQYESGSYGALTRIDLPTGGSISYTWTTVSNFSETRRRVATRTVTVGGQSYIWTFNANGTVTDPNGNQTVYDATGPGDSIKSASFYQGAATGTPLRRYDIMYASDADPWYDTANPSCPQLSQPVAVRPTSITTTLDDGKVSKTEFDYETFTYPYHPYHGIPSYSQVVQFTTSRGNVSEIREFGYTGALVRRTTRTYLHNSNTTYTNYNIVNKVLAETLYDAGASQKARTEYEYDSTALTSATGAPQHADDAYSTGFIYRGNATKVKRWRDIPAPATLLPTTYNYDTLGNILSINNPKGFTTTYNYTDRWGNSYCPPPSNSRAYVTTITNPASHRVELTYFPCSGLKQARRDENDVLNSRVGTTFAYDLLGRPTLTNFPDGGQTSISYVDTVPFLTTTTTKINATLNRVSQVEQDGLGRPRVTRLLSDPQGTVFTRTAYDGLGRAFQTWNPTRCDPDNPGTCTESTFGITETQYDALGRVTKVIPPDGNVNTNNITTQYSGNTMTVTDQALKDRRSVTDAFGRLTDVIEDPNGLAYSTTYQYDELDNLKLVTQGVQTRTFVYDSLSQLKSAANPESGTVQYTYDDNGNLATRVDARGTQTAYLYDNLDRLTTKMYTVAGSTAPTPNVTYTYDSLVSSCNSKGRLTSVYAISVSTSNTTCFDPMGRPTQSTETTGSNTYTFGYGYDLSGNLVSQTYPSGKIVSTTIDGAGRIASLQRQGGGYYAGDASNSIKYAPHGAMIQVKLGNLLWEQTRLNKRLQMNQAGIGQDVDPLTSALTAAKSNRLLLGNCFNSSIDPSGCAGVSTNNNGNVLRHLIQIQDSPGLSLTQNFTYDGVNRLDSATENGGTSSCAQTSGYVAQTYGHDRYGNHWVSAGATCGNTPTLTPTAETAFTLGAPNTSANNRLLSSGYDQSGNLTTDAMNRTFAYDAENRQTSYNTGMSQLNATYEYDGDGKRVKQIQNGITTFFVYDVQGQLAAEYSTQPSLQAASPRYLTIDHLGSTRIVTNSAGAVLTRHDYLPFGDEIASNYGGRSTIAGYGSSVSSTRQKFTGKERDAESALDFFLARYYSGAQGRFTSPDPLLNSLRPNNPQTLNRYAYVLNNPLRFIDVNGQYEQDVHRDLTSVLALAAGFDAATATAIGNATQGVDDDPKRGPYVSIAARRNFHFTTEERRNQLWDTFVTTGSETDLGTFLHAEQDSYSHAGYGPVAGHGTALPNPFAPDKTYTDPAKANQMATDTYQRLTTAAARLGVNPNNKVAWSKVDKLVGDFNKARTTQDKNKILGQIREVINKAQQEQRDRIQKQQQVPK